MELPAKWRFLFGKNAKIIQTITSDIPDWMYDDLGFPELKKG